MTATGLQTETINLKPIDRYSLTNDEINAALTTPGVWFNTLLLYLCRISQLHQHLTLQLFLVACHLDLMETMTMMI